MGNNAGWLYDDHTGEDFFFNGIRNYGVNEPLPGYGLSMPSTIAGVPAIPESGVGGAVAKAAGDTAGKFKFGWNIPSVEIGLQGLQTVSNLWNAFKMAKLARDQFNFTKEIGTANLLNSIKSYNTNLTDRATARGAMQGQTPAQVQSYIDANKLTRG